MRRIFCPEVEHANALSCEPNKCDIVEFHWSLRSTSQIITQCQTAVKFNKCVQPTLGLDSYWWRCQGRSLTSCLLQNSTSHLAEGWQQAVRGRFDLVFSMWKRKTILATKANNLTTQTARTNQVSSHSQCVLQLSTFFLGRSTHVMKKERLKQSFWDNKGFVGWTRIW